jgi:hypothetical protein
MGMASISMVACGGFLLEVATAVDVFNPSTVGVRRHRFIVWYDRRQQGIQLTCPNLSRKLLQRLQANNQAVAK